MDNQISVENIEKLTISSKKVATESGVKHVTRIQFEGEIKVNKIARLLYWQKQAQPINITFECPQAEFDLNITPVSAKTGELAPSQIPDYLK